MATFQIDKRKFNALLFLGLVLCGLTYFSINSESRPIKIYWTIFLNLLGLICICISLFYRHIVLLTKELIIINNRLGICPKKIELNKIKRVKIIDKEYPPTINNNTILHLLLWDKKFNRFKYIELFDSASKKIFTIDGQAIENADFTILCKYLKK